MNAIYFLLGFDLALLVVVLAGYLQTFEDRTPEPLGPNEPLETGISLGQRNFDFWFAETKKLHDLAQQAYNDHAWIRYWQIVTAYNVAAKRFLDAQHELLRVRI
jgi:hypothetical protein